MESQGTWSGKMSQGHSQATEGKISGVYLQKLQGLQKTEFLFLDLQGENGNRQGVSWETATVWPGASWMPSTGECPSAGKESGLLQILEDTPQGKYFLSAKACKGILRRAEKKGKKLPEKLCRALEIQSGGGREVSVIENHPDDCRAGIAGNNTVQTLTGRMGTGGGNVPLLVEHKNTVYGICSLESNAMKSSTPDSGFYKAETSRTIDCRGGNPSCNQVGMAVVDEEPVYALQGNMVGRTGKNGPQGCGVNNGISFTLTSTDHHAVAHQVFPDKSVTLAAKMCKGTGGLAGDECQNIVSTGYAVRRFTPLECGRLQGFPDGWTDGLGIEEAGKNETRFWQDAWAEWWALIGREKGIKRPKDEKAVKRWLKNPVSDTALYKMWGNGIALPCALYVFEGIAEALKEAGTCVFSGKT